MFLFQRCFFLVPAMIFVTLLNAQTAFLIQNKEYQHLVDRVEIRNDSINPQVFTSFKAYERLAVSNLVASLDSANSSKSDIFNQQYLLNDNWEHTGKGLSKKSIFKKLFVYKNALYAVNDNNFKLLVNPVLNFEAGRETNDRLSNIIRNTRGAEIRGIVDDRIAFYTYFTDNQASFQSYLFQGLPDSVPVVLGENFSKRLSTYKYDFISAKAHIAFKITKHISAQFGHDKHFIGNGHRSLILSDNAGNYNFLRLQTKIWKLQYTNLFAQLTATPRIADNIYPKKYMALHHLSMNIGKRLNIGIFESVIFGREDGGFEINYLNPVIFYRSAEQNVGSNDNALLGADWKFNFLKHFSWYGQIVIDEFLLSKLKARDGNWVNKQAFQSGLKYINAFGVKNLDLQGEFNYVRPYTYAHKDLSRSYTHYLQPMAHPRGANFRELIGIARFQPWPRLNITAKAIYLQQGLDSSLTSLSYGGNLLKDYSKRINNANIVGSTTGNKTGQGLDTKLYFLELCLSYQVKHNLFIDATCRIRKQTSQNLTSQYNSSYAGLGIRLNFARKSYDF